MGLDKAVKELVERVLRTSHSLGFGQNSVEARLRKINYYVTKIRLQISHQLQRAPPKYKYSRTHISLYLPTSLSPRRPASGKGPTFLSCVYNTQQYLVEKLLREETRAHSDVNLDELRNILVLHDKRRAGDILILFY